MRVSDLSWSNCFLLVNWINFRIQSYKSNRQKRIASQFLVVTLSVEPSTKWIAHQRPPSSLELHNWEHYGRPYGRRLNMLSSSRLQVGFYKTLKTKNAEPSTNVYSYILLGFYNLSAYKWYTIWNGFVETNAFNASWLKLSRHLKGCMHYTYSCTSVFLESLSRIMKTWLK